MKDIKRIYNSPKIVTYSSAEIIEVFPSLQTAGYMQVEIYRQFTKLQNKPAEYRMAQFEKYNEIDIKNIKTA